MDDEAFSSEPRELYTNKNATKSASMTNSMMSHLRQTALNQNNSPQCIKPSQSLRMINRMSHLRQIAQYQNTLCSPSVPLIVWRWPIGWWAAWSRKPWTSASLPFQTWTPCLRIRPWRKRWWDSPVPRWFLPVHHFYSTAYDPPHAAPQMGLSTGDYWPDSWGLKEILKTWLVRLLVCAANNVLPIMQAFWKIHSRNIQPWISTNSF